MTSHATTHPTSLPQITADGAAQFRAHPLRFFLFVLRRHPWWGGLAVACVLIAAGLNGVVYPMIGQLTDTLARTEAHHATAIYTPMWILIALIFLKNIAYRSSGFVAAHLITKISFFPERVAFAYLQQHSASYFSDRLSGKVQHKINNIVRAIDSLLSIFLWNLLSLFVKAGTVLYIAFSTNLTIGYVITIFIIVSVVYSAIASRKIGALSRKTADIGSTVRGMFVDVIGNILAVKQHNAYREESRKVSQVLDEYRIAHRKTWWYADAVIFFSNVIVICMMVVVMLLALRLWQQGAVSIGTVVTLFSMQLMFYGDLEFLGMTINRFMESYGQFVEGVEDIFVPHSITDAPDAQPFVVTQGAVAFEDVTFHYEEDDAQAVFTNFSLAIPAGQKIGLVGESGAGKSTFVKLLLRFVEPEKGVIRMDGRDIAQMRQNDVRTAIAYVPQEPLLFHRTIRENILYGNPNATEEELRTAARHAHALDFIEAFPHGFDTVVGERGIKLSGGQKQRLMIARAMLKDAPILVLDEATSALDSHAEKLIQEALDALMRGRTTIVIAHRLSTLKKMDRIVVFDNGAIREDGTHDALRAHGGVYDTLWRYQSDRL